MARNRMSFLESSADEEEDSYMYRVEWEEHRLFPFTYHNPTEDTIIEGPGSTDLMGYDNAWEFYASYANDPSFKNVVLRRFKKDK